MKALKVAKESQQQTQEDEFELQRLISLDHRHIVKYFGNFELETITRYATRIKQCIVTELCQVTEFILFQIFTHRDIFLS